MFYWENAIALHAMQRNRASSRGEGEVSCIFSRAAGTWGVFSSYDGMPILNGSLFSEDVHFILFNSACYS